MKVSVDWLNEYLSKKLSATDMAGLLEHAGAEVDDIISSNKLDTNIVIGLVKKVVQHPNADKLKMVDVSVGNETFNVVCGAPNVAEGQHVVLARVGAVLPDGTQIKAAEIRGRRSHGMICSQYELGLGDDHSGILVLSPESKSGTPAQAVLGTGEVLDLTTPANRPDLQSVVGLARELAAVSGAQLKQPKLPEIASAGKSLKVVIDTDLALRYMLQQFALDASHPTGDFALKRLRESDVRPINIAVDITNYVLHEYGQPLHAFDADKVKLPITVRMAKKGETLVTLDEVERSLTKEDLIIADHLGPIALAGVMGGLRTSVTEKTRHILVESATFDAATVRKSAARHGLRTDASARFERGLPVQLAEVGMQRAADIITAAVQGKPESKCHDSLKREIPSVSVQLRLQRLAERLGMSVPLNTAKQLLEQLGFGVHGTETLDVVVPWWRTDVVMEEDLIEEIGRSLGYDDLPATLPAWRPNAVQFDRRQARIWHVKAALRSLGLFETVTYSFVSAEQLRSSGYGLDEHLKLKNPLSSEQEYLRSSLLPSLLSVVARNVRYSSNFGLFELSRVFDAPADRTELPSEPLHLAVMRRMDYAAIREALDLIAAELHVPLSVEPAEVVGMHPHRAGQVSLHGELVGVAGEVHPAITRRAKISGALSFLELDMDMLLAAAGTPTYKTISRYPSIARDLAVVIADNVSWADVALALKEYNVEYLSEYRGSDVPAGSRSLALRLTFVSQDRTLTDAEADAELSQVLDTLKREFKATPRT